VTHAFKSLLQDKNVKAVLESTHLRRHSTGRHPGQWPVVEAANQDPHSASPSCSDLRAPTFEQGREILKRSGLNFIVAETIGRCPKRSSRRRVGGASHEHPGQRKTRLVVQGLTGAKARSTPRVAPNTEPRSSEALPRARAAPRTRLAHLQHGWRSDGEKPRERQPSSSFRLHLRRTHHGAVDAGCR